MKMCRLPVWLAVMMATGCGQASPVATKTVIACAADGTCPHSQCCVSGVCEAQGNCQGDAGSDGVASDAKGASDAPATGDGKASEAGTCDPNLAGGPTPRGDVAGGFVGGKLVVVFGDDGAPIQCQPNPKAVSDAWVLDPCVGWQAMTGELPPPRARAASAVDPDNDQLWLYGGRYRSPTVASGKYSVYGDLWRYDVKSGAWLFVHDGKSAAPQARSNTVLARRPGDGSLWLMGGNLSNDGLNFQPMNDVWRFAVGGGGWQKQQTQGTSPPVRLFHAGAITADGSSLVIVGGGGVGAFQGPFMQDAWRLDLDKLTWTPLKATGSQPLGRIKAGLVAVPGVPRLLLFGGHDDGPVGNRNDLWWLDPQTGAWEVARIGDLGAGNDPDMPFKKANAFCDFPPDFTQVDKDSPERREAFLFAWDPGSQRAWLFGGKSDCGTLRDIWTLDPRTLKWESIDDTPKGWSCVRYQSPCNTLCN
jgi:hypothetical protein